jgi:hypothetical protein
MCQNGACVGVAQKTGCNGQLNCENNCVTTVCAAGDMTCLTNCDNTCAANATSQANSLFSTLVTCVYQTACPAVQATDPCSTSNPNYATACQMCINTAVAAGGKCFSQFTACTQNTP